jgi:hypothetical protein
MKKIATLAIALLLAGALAAPGLTATAQGQDSNPAAEQVQSGKTGKAKVQKRKKGAESKGSRLHKAHFDKRAAAKARRDAAIELRNQNISTDNPGNTGM